VAQRVILVTQETEIRRIEVQRQSRQIISRDPILKKSFTKKVLMEWLKVKALSSNPSTAKYINKTLDKVSCKDVTVTI
jgi:hypothetical protein